MEPWQGLKVRPGEGGARREEAGRGHDLCEEGAGSWGRGLSWAGAGLGLGKERLNGLCLLT